MTSIIPPFDDLDQQTGVEDGTKIGFVGVLLHLRPGNDSIRYEHQIARAKDSSSEPGTALTSTWQNVGRLPIGQRDFFDQLPNDRVKRRYRARAIRPGETEGMWTDEVCARPVIITGEVLDAWRQYRDEGRDRADSLWDGDGKLNDGVSVNDQSGVFGINRHNESGLAQDGDAISFSQDYKANPEFTFTLECGRSYVVSGTTEDQFIDMRAVDVTTTGFTLSAKIITGPGTSENVDGFSAAQPTTGPENGDETLTADEDEAFSTLEDATTAAATYQVYFDVNTALMSSTETATVSIYTSTGNGSTSYTFRAARSYGSGKNLSDELLQFSASLAADYAIRSQLTYAGTPGPSFAAVITMHGEDNSEPGVQWLKPTAGTEASMTPNSGDRVRWHAVEAP